MLVENKNMPNGRNKYTNSEKCNWCPACVLQVEPHMGSMTLSPFSGEEKIKNSFPVLVLWDNCWCHHCTASFPLQNTDILSMSVHRDALRNPGEVVLKTISLLQAVVGSLDDVILFFHSNSPILFGRKKRRTDMILTHLALANLLIILFSGIPHIMAVFVLRNPLNSCGCKFVYYIQRVACGTALCSTCVLSTSVLHSHPQESGVGDAQRKGPQGRWSFPLHLLDAQSLNEYLCSFDYWSRECKKWYWQSREVVLLTHSSLHSGSMVLLLHRHQQRMQYIHTPTGHRGCPPETRAPHTILMLVLAFVIFYVLNSIFFYISLPF